MLIVLCLQCTVAIKCHRNFTDEIIEARIQVKLEKLQKQGKGDFSSPCPLFEPNSNTTVDFDCGDCIFSMKISRSACVAANYPESKIPKTYIELEKNASIEDVRKFGGSMSLSQHYSRILSRNDIFYLPYSTIYADVQHYRIRDINERSQTVTMDISLSMTWMDNHIYTHAPSDNDTQSVIFDEGHELYSGARTSIWRPDVPISNLSDYKSFHASTHVTSWKVLRSNYIDGYFCLRGPMLRYDVTFTASFFCDFELSNYPVDISTCSLWIGGQSSNIAFKWSTEAPKNFNTRPSSIFDVIANVNMVEATHDIWTKAKIGLEIEIKRVLKPFILKYYIPCFAIVFMAQLSFLIPLESLPARVGLVVTQFLTLISLFIQQMVNKLCDNLSKLVHNIKFSIFIYSCVISE